MPRCDICLLSLVLDTLANVFPLRKKSREMSKHGSRLVNRVFLSLQALQSETRLPFNLGTNCRNCAKRFVDFVTKPTLAYRPIGGVAVHFNSQSTSEDGIGLRTAYIQKP